MNLWDFFGHAKSANSGGKITHSPNAQAAHWNMSVARVGFLLQEHRFQHAHIIYASLLFSREIRNAILPHRWCLFQVALHMNILLYELYFSFRRSRLETTPGKTMLQEMWCLAEQNCSKFHDLRNLRELKDSDIQHMFNSSKHHRSPAV